LTLHPATDAEDSQDHHKNEKVDPDGGVLFGWAYSDE